MSLPAWRSRHGYPPLPEDDWDLPEDRFRWMPPVDHPELALDIETSRIGQEAPVPTERGDAKPGPAAPELSDEPIPARMLNEFVYCPRLFYYEHVEGVFVESGDTERGKAIHRKVDRGKGELRPAKAKTAATTNANEQPPPANGAGADAKPSAPGDPAATAPAPDIVHSRSATLGSDRLGTLAKMDLIEVELESDSAPPPAESATVDSSGFRDSPDSPDSPDSSDSSDSSDSPDSPDAAQPATPARITRKVQGDLFDPPPVRPAAEPPPIAASATPRGARDVRKVTPVDYKVGAPRSGDDGNELWDADRMQLGVQILILRDNGYTCDEGVIYYRATKQRVSLAMTPELEAWIVRNIAAARAASRGAIPPPLVDSPKCVRCSLAPVCLPDETRMLAAAAHGPNAAFLPPNPSANATPPRRLIAARDDSRALYLNTQGTRVGLRGETLVVKDDKKVVGEFRTLDVSHVALFGNIQLTTQAVHWLCQAGIPVTYFSMGGWFYGITRGHGLKNVFTRIEQFDAARDPAVCLALARKFIYGKIRNHRTQMMRNHVSLPQGVALKLKRATYDALSARSLAELLGMEGAAAALYFKHFAGMLKVGPDDEEIPGIDAPTRPTDPGFDFDFTRRTRRPPTDPVNALLSLAYSLLTKDCTIAALAVGFDPYVGYYHQPRHGRPALALDLMEEFRPLVAESAVLTAINNRMITPSHFVRAGHAVNLNAHGRKAFFNAYEQRMNALVTHPVFDYKASYRRVLELQARVLARFLTGEIPDYIPMTTR